MYTDEEKKQLEYLYKLYYAKDQAFEKAKGKRFRLTVLAFTIAYQILFYTICTTAILPEDTEFGGLLIIFLILIIPSAIVSFVHVLINATIFGQLAQKGREEYEELQAIKRKINAIKDDPPTSFWYPDDDF